MNQHELSQKISNWCDRGIVTSVYAVALLTPFIFTWVTSELFEFNKMLFVYAIAIFCLGAMAVKMIVHNKWLIAKTAFDIPMGLFVSTSILSTLFSIHPHTSFWGYYSRFNGGLASVLAYTAIFYVAASTLKRKHLPALIVTLLLSLLGSSLYSFPEHFGYSPSCTLIRGEFNASCWRQDVQQRVFGTFGQPNWLAAYIVLLLPLAIVLPVVSKKVPIQIAAAGALLLSYPTLLFTKSRSGFLSFGVSILFLALGLLFIYSKKFYRKVPSQEKKHVLIYLSAACGFLVFSSLVFGTPYSPSFSELTERFASSRSEEVLVESATQPQEIQPTNRLEVGGTDSGEIRKIVWQGAIDVWRRYPLLGSGVETFAYSYYLDRPVAHNTVSEWDFLYNKAHNEFLNLLATTGIIGFLSYVTLLTWFGVKTLSTVSTYSSLKTKQATQDAVFLIAILSGVIALNVSNFLGFATVAVTVVLYLFFLIAHLLFSNDDADNTKEQNSERFAPLKLWQEIVIGLIIIITAVLLIGIRNRWQADWYFNKGLQAANMSYVQESIPLFLQAIRLQPREAVFYDELASSYSKIAYVLAKQDIQEIEDQKSEITYDQLSSQTQQFMEAAISSSDTALALNGAHLNFYKTRIRILLLLSEFNQVFLEEAEQTTHLAISLTPTDPKLVLTMAEIRLIQGDATAAAALLQESVSLKPNYETARMALAELYLEAKNYPAALEQYEYVLTFLSPENEIATLAVQEIQEQLKNLEINQSQP